MPSLRVEGLSKTYIAPDRARFSAVQHLGFRVVPGECLSLVGPSGCGKSTTLRLIAGLESPDAGRIWLDDREITSLEPADRGIAFLFQNAALYPHLTVRENLRFPLKVRGLGADQTTPRVAEAIERFGLLPLADRQPEFLSGGERQRVSLARAWIQQPKVLLLDEPFSGLDAPCRQQLRRMLQRVQTESSLAVVHVTHDQCEALAMGDHVAVLRSGVLQQLAPPHAVYHQPKNTFVAGFMGAPGMNLIEGTLHREPAGTQFRATPSQPPLPIDIPSHLLPPQGTASVTLGFRPESARRIPDPGASAGFEMDWAECRGPDWLVAGRWHGIPVHLVEGGSKPTAHGRYRLEFEPGGLHWFDASTGERV